MPLARSALAACEAAMEADGFTAEISADRFVIAAGSRAVTPDIPGLDTVAYHTSDTVMRIDELPARVLIVGGGYIAAEFGHVFASLGAAVTQVARGERLLRHLDAEVSQRYTEVTAARYAVHLGSVVTSVAPSPNGYDAIRAEITGATDVLGMPALAGAAVTPMAKTLVADLSTTPGLDPLDNIEGLTLGPRLSDGRQTVVLVSDDNFSPREVTQFVAFAIPAD